MASPRCCCATASPDRTPCRPPRGKAWTAVSFRTGTGELAEITKPGLPQAGVRALPGVVAIAGGLMVEAGGSLVGGIGVSGAPGGEVDEACARAGIEAVRDRLEF